MSAQEVFKKGWVPQVQGQVRPGLHCKLNPPPIVDVTADGHPYKPAGKMIGKTAIVTGGDSGIGRSIALLYALEGANLTLTYLKQEESDARDVHELIKKKASQCKVLLVETEPRHPVGPSQLLYSKLCLAVLKVFATMGRKELYPAYPILALNNGKKPLKLVCVSLSAVLPSMSHGGSIIYNASVNPFVGYPQLVDYTAAKGAIIGLMRALSNQIVGENGIRVNAVAPGPIWTPLIVSTMTDEKKKTFGTTVPMGRAGQPVEIATCFVFLASADSSYISGQVIHANGGVVVN